MSELALQLIAEAKRSNAKVLDLGSCGLTELPDELFELTQLFHLTNAKVTSFTKGVIFKLKNFAGFIFQIKRLHLFRKDVTLKNIPLSGSRNQ